MKLSSFLKLVEIQTKVASIIPFFAGIIFTYYRYKTIKPLILVVYLICLLCIDMATTAINNYMDFKRAIRRKGYNYERHNAIVKFNLSEGQVITAILLLLITGAAFGLALFIMTDVVVLVIGIIAFGVGIIYSFGPVPFSRTPFGELFSGIMMGGFIFFIALYTQVYEFGFIHLVLSEWIFTLNVDIYELLVIAVVCMPYILMIANIMLANNICDIEDDLVNKRYTLPNYIGKSNALILFAALYYASYLFIIAGVVLNWLPLTSLLVLLTIFPVHKGIRAFNEKHVKAETFVISVKNFVLIGATYSVSILISLLFELSIKSFG